ncbi:hypothetical protein ACFYWS_20665 [Streptomyces sp. NPDC002795]|uniref:hypothetical protein n=1 Tax=Streptomyces sp. NPDC002795 TaxID=3364665 RepID=UPI0036BE7EC5
MGYDLTFAEPREDEPHNFRIGYFTMPSLIDAMTELGMAVELPHPAWPNPDDMGVSVEEARALVASGAELPSGVQRQVDGERAARTGEADDPQGIPAYKLRTNDAWQVTPNEITAALAALGRAPEQPQDGLWPHWVDYLRRARERGGFLVH